VEINGGGGEICLSISLWTDVTKLLLILIVTHSDDNETEEMDNVTYP